MFRKAVLYTVLMFFVFTFVGCNPGEKNKELVPASSTPVARVGERVITVGDLQDEAKLYANMLNPAGKENIKHSISLKKALLDRLINDTVLDIEADRLKIVVTEENLEKEIGLLLGAYDEAKLGLVLSANDVTFDEWKSALQKRLKVRKLVILEVDSKITIDEKVLKEYFNVHSEKFRWPERVRARQIMVEDEAKAEKIRKKLLGKEDFAKIAKESSQSPDAVEGGDLGYFSRGQMPPEFENVVFELKVGQVSEVVRSIYGFHIFKVIAKEKPRAMKFEDARNRIRDILLTKNREEEFKNWITEIKKGLIIEVYAESLSASSL